LYIIILLKIYLIPLLYTNKHIYKFFKFKNNSPNFCNWSSPPLNKGDRILVTNLGAFVFLILDFLKKIVKYARANRKVNNFYYPYPESLSLKPKGKGLQY